MSAFIAAIPIILIRYALLGSLSKEALGRAASFAPLEGNEKPAYWVYQATTLLILVALIFQKIRTDSAWFYPGAVIYILGLALYAQSMADFARPEANGMNVQGLYRFSRNPMYAAYFMCLLGCSLLSASWMLLMLLMIFQAASHWIILSEERWCIQLFGEHYLRYMGRVRRYL